MKSSYIFVFILPLLVSCHKTLSPEKGNDETIWNESSIVELSVETESAISRTIGQFGLNTYDLLRSDCYGHNFVLSPISCANALAMTALGAFGSTLSEISQALGIESFSNEEVGAFAYKLNKELTKSDDLVEYNSANSMWIRKDFPVKTSYVKQAALYYDAYVASLDFSNNPENIINKWVELKTNGLIKDAAPFDIKSQSMVFVNSVYFNSPWSSKPRTCKLSFTNIEGTTSEQSALDFIGAYPYYSDDKYTYLALPFGKQGTFNFELFLPQTISDKDAINKFETIRNKADICNINAIFPLLDISSKIDLAETLRQLGIRTAFSEKADFKYITDQLLSLGIVFHNSTIIINEDGGVGAASTVIAAPSSPGPGEGDVINILFNKPYIFAISEKSTGAILFLGHKVQ